MKNSSARSQKSEPRILVLEPDDSLGSTILSALHEAVPEAIVDLARSLEDAHRLAVSDRPDLFVLDLDAAKDLGQDFLLDLRTSYANARAIVLSGVHLDSQREQAGAMGAIHFLEKPLPRTEFIELVQMLVQAPAEEASGEKFQGTLSDLHLSDIIQLKCMSGATSALEFTGPAGEKARVYFENGQVRHATTPGNEGVEAFNEIVSWRGGKISEVSGASSPPPTIDLDWQFLLMEAVRKVDETSALRAQRKNLAPSQRQKILVIDDSLMLLTFVQEILTEASYDVVVAATAQEGLEAARAQNPDLILLDYLLPDLRGDEVSRLLYEDEATTNIRVLYMSGFGADLASEQSEFPNVLAILNKPFSSDMLLKAVEQHLPRMEGSESSPAWQKEEESVALAEFSDVINGGNEQPLSAGTAPFWNDEKAVSSGRSISAAPPADAAVARQPYLAGDSSFLSINCALRTIGREKLTGVLSCSWAKADVHLYAAEGKVMLVTTRDANLYCGEAPITLVNVEPERLEEARANQERTSAPMFMALMRDDLMLRDPALQLVQHYGQKLFAQLWCAPRVRFAFTQLETLPDFAREMAGEEDMDQWALATLRLVQFPDITAADECDPSAIPAYTREGFERVQDLRLTVAEAQFASQFNGMRSVAQIARNLRLDLKFARVTLFRFLALEIVECWPPSASETSERGGVLKRLGRSIGIGE